MPPDPSKPGTWLLYAKSDLAVAKTAIPGALRETFCFHAQQAAEKSIKAVLILEKLEFPRTHNLEFLVGLLPGKLAAHPALHRVQLLSPWATTARYPGASESVSEMECRELTELAESIVAWAQKLVDPP